MFIYMFIWETEELMVEKLSTILRFNVTNATRDTWSVNSLCFQQYEKRHRTLLNESCTHGFIREMFFYQVREVNVP